MNARSITFRRAWFTLQALAAAFVLAFGAYLYAESVTQDPTAFPDLIHWVGAIVWCAFAYSALDWALYQLVERRHRAVQTRLAGLCGLPSEDCTAETADAPQSS